jgi:DNA-directed RNA polymerase I subunit RPA1
MTIRGSFFTRQEYYQLVYAALNKNRGNIRTVLPAILKPERLWSGKQVITTLLLNLTPTEASQLNLISTAELAKSESDYPFLIGSRSSELGEFMGESSVGIYHGNLLHGVLDKNQLGSTPYSMVHAFHEVIVQSTTIEKI